MKVTQHIPTVFDLVAAPRFEGDIVSLAQLTQEPFVQNFWKAPAFSQFSRTPDGVSGFYLLAEFEGGARFYVVARMQGTDAEAITRALPLWKGPPK